MTKSLPPKSLVLYADDDQDDIELVKEAFADFSEQIQLATFKDGVEILEYIRQLDSLKIFPCLIILDINMPRLNGKTVLSKIREMENFSEVPVVLFSTSTLPSEAAFAKTFGATFITKPLYAGQIHQLLDQMTEHCAEDLKKIIKTKRKS